MVRRLDDFDASLAGAGVCVLPAEGALGLRAHALLERARRVEPAVRIVVFIPRHVSTSRDVPALMRAGAHEMILEGIDVFSARLREIVHETEESTVGARIVAAVAPSIPRELRAVSEWSALEAHRAITVVEMAERAGMSVRKLERRMKATLQLRPVDWIWWLRLLYALDARPRCRSWEDVAGRFGFSGGWQVKRMIRRGEELLSTELVGVSRIFKDLFCASRL